MMTSDETQLMSGRQVANRQNNDRKESNNASSPIKEHKGSWKKVAFGAASGILVGAGAIYATSALGAENSNDADTNGGQTENVKVAKVDGDLSFQDAFDAARGQVGSGGVFRWHGGLYSTYNEDEWNKLSDDEKAEFAQAVRPEVRADEIVAERMSEMQPQVVVIKEKVVAGEPQQAAEHVGEDVQMARNVVGKDQTQVGESEDVHVVGQGYVEGHQAVALDLTGNGEADMVIIDVNDNGQLDDPDVVVDREGYMATVGQIAQAQTEQGLDDSNQYWTDEVDMAGDPNRRLTGDDDTISSTGVDDSVMTDDGSLNVLM